MGLYFTMIKNVLFVNFNFLLLFFLLTNPYERASSNHKPFYKSYEIVIFVQYCIPIQNKFIIFVFIINQ